MCFMAGLVPIKAQGGEVAVDQMEVPLPPRLILACHCEPLSGPHTANPHSIARSVPACMLVNLNDGTLEGLRHRRLPIFSSSTIPRQRRVRTTAVICSRSSAG
jgi:hypothetical protein